MTTEKTKRNDAIDAFRALSILSVLAFHYCVRWTTPYDNPPHFAAAAKYAGIAPFHYGWMGVEFFFMLSGFVILKTLLSTDSLPQFAANRFARLWPPLAFCAALTAIVVLLIGPADWHRGIDDYAANLTLIDPRLISRITGHDVSYIDGAYWSLWVEVRFYVWAAFLFLVAGRKHFVGALVALTTLSSLVLLLPVPPIVALTFEEALFPRFLPYFTFGVLVFALTEGRSLRLWAYTGWVSLLILLCGYLRFASWNTGNATGFTFVNLGMIAAMLSVALDLSWLRILAQRPLVLIGQASYSLYLLHENIGVSIMDSLTKRGWPVGPVILAVAAGMVGCSLLLYFWFENPARRLMRNLLAPIVRKATSALPTLKFPLPARPKPVAPGTSHASSGAPSTG